MNKTESLISESQCSLIIPTLGWEQSRRSKGKGKLITARDRGLFLLRAPKFPLPLPLLTPATQATPILVSCFVVCILQFYGNRKSKLGI